MTNATTGTILVAIDGSKNSMLAAGFAARLAKSLGAHLGLLHVLDMPVLGFWANIEVRMKDDIRVQAEKTLTEISTKISEVCEIVPEFYIVEGIPEEEILRAVSEDPRIMMVVTGRGGLATEKRSHPKLRRASGRFSAKLSENLPVPLLIVPPDVEATLLCSAMAEYSTPQEQ